MMDVWRGAERLMGMDDAAWARHASPASVWSRFTVLPLLALAVYSRVWFGAWALVPIGLALAWTWANPRLFAAPPRLDAWPTRAVLGERVFLVHRDRISAHHRRAAVLLTWASLPGAAVLGWGLWALWPAWTAFGVVLTVLPKAWFCNRMAWLHDDWIAAGGAVPGRGAA
ncbi:DUF6653 family protein [Jannaschia sp. LMIT008]|uniref:DUF6653 family protein n=1 Tax=Jannaschia maritima TaxID=3032585 RepID=UPI0028113DDF|nr:DUF6653 family protein [Jannaschia sp. LMIT008]